MASFSSSLRLARRLAPRSPIKRPTLAQPKPWQRRALASTAHCKAGNHSDHASHEHESPYNPPGSWLWGRPPGEKYEKEGWENIWFYGYWGALLALVVVYAFKPDTTIQTWALEEARRRLEVEGILPDPYSNGNAQKNN